MQREFLSVERGKILTMLFPRILVSVSLGCGEKKKITLSLSGLKQEPFMISHESSS